MTYQQQIDGSLALRNQTSRVITIAATEKPKILKLRVAAYPTTRGSPGTKTWWLEFWQIGGIPAKADIQLSYRRTKWMRH